MRNVWTVKRTAGSVAVLAVLGMTSSSTSPTFASSGQIGGAASLRAQHQAVTEAAMSFAAKGAPCATAATCVEPAVFVDGRRVAPRFVALVASQLATQRRVGAAALASDLATTGSVTRDALAVAARSALLFADAHNLLGPDEMEEVQARAAAAASMASPPVPDEFRTEVAEAEASIGRVTDPVAARQVYVQAFILQAMNAKWPSVDQQRGLIQAALQRHKVEFSPVSGLTPQDVQRATQ